MMIRDVPAWPGLGRRCSGPIGASVARSAPDTRKRTREKRECLEIFECASELAGSLPALRQRRVPGPAQPPRGARSPGCVALLQAQGLGAQDVRVVRSCGRVCSTADQGTADSSFKLSVLTLFHPLASESRRSCLVLCKSEAAFFFGWQGERPDKIRLLYCSLHSPSSLSSSTSS